MFLSKYGAARHIYIPIIKRAVVDFAVGADWAPVAGDVKISKDGAAAGNVASLPTAITMGNGAVWDFSLSATEMQAAQILVTVVDAAAKAVEDQSFIIETYGNASAQHAFDLGTASTAQTGDSFARLGAPAGASVSADIAAQTVAQIVAGVLGEVIEGAVTFRQMLRLYASALGAKLSGAGTTTVRIRDLGDTKDRIIATVDTDGNRTTVTRDLT